MPGIVRVVKNEIHLTSAWDDRDRCKLIPGGHWSKATPDRSGYWAYPATPAICKAIVIAFRGTKLRGDSHFATLIEQAKAIKDAQALKHAEDLPPIPLTLTTPWKHQLQAYHFAYNMPACMLALDMGPQPLDEPVLTVSGWKEMGELQVGDAVIGSSGKLTIVEEIREYGSLPTWSVKTYSGEYARCAPTHIWAAHCDFYGDSEWETVTAFEIRCYLRLGKRVFIPCLGKGSVEVSDSEPTSDSCPMRCISVSSNNGLYVTRDYLVTHNCGKSKILADLVVNRNHRKTLIAAPLSVIQEWPNQFRMHAGIPVMCVPLDDRVGSVRDKTHAAKIALMQADLENIPVVLVANYESIWRAPFDEFAMNAGFDLVACDEIHRIQSAGGKSSMFMSKLGREVPFRLGLSGTPFSSGPLSVYGEYRFLDPGIFGTRFDKFKEEYAILQQGGRYKRDAEKNQELDADGQPMMDHFMQVVGFKNQEQLQSKFYSIAFRVMARDVLDLPEEQHIRRFCQLSPHGYKVYREMEDTFRAELKDGEVTATNALVKLLRLAQLTGGFLKTDETEETPSKIVRVDTSKQKLLEDILTDLDREEPVIVFARFTADLDVVKAVCEAQGRRYAELSGRKNQLEGWRRGDSDVIGTQIQAGGVGIDLTRARYVIYFSVGYSLGQYTQSLARAMRPGQRRSVSYYYLIAEKTVDVKIWNALEKKQDIVDSVLGDLR